MSSYYGHNLHISIFGQSHSTAIGVVADGLPAGFSPDMEQLRAFMARRAPGNSDLSTPRKEKDQFEILSGLTNGTLCGAPLAAEIRNENTRSGDYAPFAHTPRPGHADYTAHVKFHGHQDVSGGGHFSGRLTAPLCLIGGICLQLLAKEGIYVLAHIDRLAGISDAHWDPVTFRADSASARVESDLPVLDASAGAQMRSAIQNARAKGDSVGGIIECGISGLPAGMGEPMFDGMENRLSAAIFAIPAIKGIEFGAGFAAADMTGSEHNDDYHWEGDQVLTTTNHHGGILGGITSGMPLLFRVAVKPTPSIFQPQNSVNLETHVEETLQIQGRHDPCIVPRAVPCVEAVTAIVLYDAWLDYQKYR